LTLAPEGKPKKATRRRKVSLSPAGTYGSGRQETQGCFNGTKNTSTGRYRGRGGMKKGGKKGIREEGPKASRPWHICRQGQKKTRNIFARTETRKVNGPERAEIQKCQDDEKKGK